MSEKTIRLGTVKAEAKLGACGTLHLHKHEWQCDWYWSFGWISGCGHTHFDLVFLQDCKLAKEVFSDTKLTDADWWIVRDLMIQAYALKKAAEVYKHGGYQTDSTPKVIINRDMHLRINHDLGLVLDTVWNFLKEKCR